VRRHIVPALAILAVAIFTCTSIARAKPYESFTLEEHDKIIAETPGCFASCTVMGTKRTCTVKDFNCKAVCTLLQECKPDGLRPMKVCAVIRESK
jgi:hypothetical protein